MNSTHLSMWQICIPLTLLLLIITGCVGQTTIPPSNPGHDGTHQPKQISLGEAVSQVEHFSAPVDPALLGKLKDKLAEDLQNLGIDKIVATPPRGPGNKVTDLVIDNSTAQLGWTYVNTGDYDQNREVNTADLTPVAIFFGMTPADADWVNALVADGDNNLEINLADITPIAVNFLNSVTAYNVYSSADLADVPVLPSDQNGPGTALAETIVFEDANEPPGFKTFTQLLSAPVDLSYYWVRPTDGVELGAASNSVQFESPGVLNIPPTADISADPTVGDVPLDVDFDATLSTDTDGTIVLYEWDWDGAVGGLNWESTGATGTAQHTYDVEGTYNATVRVTDDLSATDTANITIVVNEVVVTGFSVSGQTVKPGLPPLPLPSIEVHLRSTTGGSYEETVISSGGDPATFEFTNVPGDDSYEIWCDDPAWLWPPFHRPIPNTGVLTEDVEGIFMSTNGPA